MPSQFFGLNIAYSGLTAANAALNTTSNNISNVETEGYSRQQVKQQAAAALRVFASYGCAGAGVETLAIERIRDEFYDYKYWNNNTKAGEYNVKQYYMKQIENYLMDDPDKQIEGFKTIFNRMYDAMEELKNAPGEPTKKEQFIGWANNLTNYFNDVANNLQERQEDINLEIQNKVQEINSIAREISVLNKQINTVEMSGIAANELRDQRTLLIDQLSSIVNVEVKETPIADSGYPDRVTGANRYIVRIGGQILVDTNDYEELECITRKSSEKVNQTDVDGLFDIQFKSTGQGINFYGGNISGELKGLMQMRDGNNGDYFHGTLAGVGTTTINGTDYDTVTIDVDKDYLTDVNKLNLSDTGGKIMIGGKEYSYDSWTMTTTVDAAGDSKTSYSFVLSDTNQSAPVAGSVGYEAYIGSKIDYQGIPYYQSQMNEWIRTYSQCVNEILTQPGAVNGVGANNYALFVADKLTAQGQWTFEGQEWQDVAGGGKQLVVSSASDSYYRLTAFNFNVHSELVKHPDFLATHTGSVDELDKSDIVDELIDLKTNRDKMTFRNRAAGEFLECIQADIALNTKSADVFYNNYSNISQSIDTYRNSVSGVDNDEEGVNLVKYQNAYNLASKMIQMFTEIYDRLILQTGV